MTVSMKAAGLAVVMAFIIPAVARASPETDALSACMVKATTQQDRVVLMDWFFSLTSRHPAVKDMVAIPEARYTEINKASGELFTRLLTENCPSETRAAVRVDGVNAISIVISALGEAAMTELMADPAVVNGLSGIAPYLDQEKLIGVLSGGQ